MATWQKVYEMDKRKSNKCLRVWYRQWFAGTGDGFLSHDGEILEAEGVEAQRIYDQDMHENEMSAL